MRATVIMLDGTIKRIDLPDPIVTFEPEGEDPRIVGDEEDLAIYVGSNSGRVVVKRSVYMFKTLHRDKYVEISGSEVARYANRIPQLDALIQAEKL